MKEGGIMLKKFTVKNFRGFENLEYDLSKTHDYKYNTQSIKNGISKNSLIYGKNAVGKSNLGFAIFDIVMTITDRASHMKRYYNNYKNINDIDKPAIFIYEFIFDNDLLKYEYSKNDVDTLLYEKLSINDKIIIDYDFEGTKKDINIPEAKKLNFEYYENEISIVKYILNNTNLNGDHVIKKLMEFVNGMLWFRSVEANQYIGFKKESETLVDIIVKNDKLKDFQDFLSANEIKYKLVLMDNMGVKRICIKYSNGKIADFEQIISTGTRSLWLYYCWKLSFSSLSFVFIDEFDAYYHYELAAKTIEALKEQEHLQSIVTTHNVSLMNNKLTRPDCVYIITSKGINNLSNSTDKELREAHNLEKLYKEGSFVE